VSLSFLLSSRYILVAVIVALCDSHLTSFSSLQPCCSVLQWSSLLTEFVTAELLVEHVIDEYYSDGDRDYERSEDSDSIAGGQGHDSNGEAEGMVVKHDYNVNCCP
jgi:hypothetical protein